MFFMDWVMTSEDFGSSIILWSFFWVGMVKEYDIVKENERIINCSCKIYVSFWLGSNFLKKVQRNVDLFFFYFFKVKVF